jgi:hypothetical protein
MSCIIVHQKELAVGRFGSATEGPFATSTENLARRTSYRMKYGTFKRLATDLRPYIIAAIGRTGTPP